METDKFNLFDFNQSRIKILHITWFAFFITFFMWFCHASLMPLIKETFGLSADEAKALLVLNVALTIPARTLVGMLVDRWGPRLMFSMLLVISGILCLGFASAQNYAQLAFARFLLGFSGAGFVIGIRLITEWFPVKQAGTAQGIYGGWGNFGAAAAGFILPSLAAYLGVTQLGEIGGWRLAVAAAGIISILYAVVFYSVARDTPKGSTYFSPKKMGAMEVTSKGDFVLYIIMNIPMSLALGILAWRLGPSQVGLLSVGWVNAIYVGLVLYFANQVFNIYKVNKENLVKPVDKIHRYKFKQVALLNISYMVTFGSEVAVVSMLTLFLTEIFPDLSLALAGAIGSSFMAMNLVARPLGGYLSDKVGRKRTLLAVLIGSSVGYYGMGLINPDWSIAWLATVVVLCSFFVQAGAGAVFGIVPTVKRRLTGQIAGLTGAYGNVGAASYLLIFSLTNAQTFFMVIAISCIVVAILVKLFLDEPRGQMAEILPDGSVQLINVT